MVASVLALLTLPVDHSVFGRIESDIVVELKVGEVFCEKEQLRLAWLRVAEGLDVDANGFAELIIFVLGSWP